MKKKISSELPVFEESILCHPHEWEEELSKFNTYLDGRIMANDLARGRKERPGGAKQTLLKKRCLELLILWKSQQTIK